MNRGPVTGVLELTRGHLLHDPAGTGKNYHELLVSSRRFFSRRTEQVGMTGKAAQDSVSACLKAN